MRGGRWRPAALVWIKFLRSPSGTKLSTVDADRDVPESMDLFEYQAKELFAKKAEGSN